MAKPAPRGAFRDLSEALRLINGVRTGYDLTHTEQQRLLSVAVDLRRVQQRIEARCILAPAQDDERSHGPAPSPHA